jgi:bacterioferritin (cytochrome b1)
VLGCGSHAHSSSSAKKPPPSKAGDVELLNHALDLEYFVAAAYTASTPLLRGRAHTAAKLFLGQELAHISRLISLIHHFDGLEHAPQASYDLGHPRGTTEILRLLNKVEQTVIAGYLAVVPKLRDGKARSDLSAILANDAQHVSVLNRELGRSLVPAPFLGGRA